MKNLQAIMYIMVFALIFIVPLGAIVYWKHTVWAECRQANHGVIYCWHIL